MDWKAKVGSEIDNNRTLLENLALEIGKNPELGFVEYHASKLLTSALEHAGFKVTKGLGGLETAFQAVLGTGKPNIALLCEYDALPEIGHACGHNLIGTASVGAALGLAPVMEQLGGTITVIGAPGEETGGGKVLLVDGGHFAGVDVAMMFHPANQNLLMSPNNAIDAYEFVFHGKEAHAASAPEEGVNALDGVISLFNGINALREHLPSSVRIHGIISEGGKAPNVVPALASARFYLRAPQRTLLDEVAHKVFKIAEGAALMTGTEVTWHQFEPSNDNFIPNHTLALVFGANLQRLGVADIGEFAEGKGSSDIGNVSQIVPAIHPYLSIGEGIVAHTVEFAEASLSSVGLATMITAAKGLAYTAVDLLTHPHLLESVQREHEEI